MITRASTSTLFDRLVAGVTFLLAVHGGMNLTGQTPLRITLPAGLAALTLLVAIIAYDRRRSRRPARG